VNTVHKSIQLSLILPFFQSFQKFRSAITSTAQMRSYCRAVCAPRTCSGSRRGNCLGWRSNPYLPRYRPTALTNQLLVRLVLLS